MKPSLRVLAVLVGLVVCLGAQVPQTGDLVGVVANRDGGVLPGVSLTITGATLPEPRTTVTNASGAYYVVLPGGSYAITFKLAGFFSLTRDVVVEAGKHGQLNVALAVGPVTTDPGLLDFAPAEVLVRLETSLGNIDLAIDATHAPITAANFLKYVDGGFYDGGRFHRSTRPDNYNAVLPNRPPMEIIQGGPNPEKVAGGKGFPPIPLERTSVTGIKHVTGVVSMARGNTADTGTSDFFILLNDQPSLDFGGKRFDDAQGAAAFGRVIAGLDVVRKTQQQPVQERPATPDNPLTKNDRLAPPVPIVKASRIQK
jgi:peptidyl-prolyl cis-trans isomerase A (cyclophilin A)